MRTNHSLLNVAGVAYLAGLTSVFPVRLAAQDDASILAVRGGTVHTLTGPAIPNGTVVIRDGKIAAVGADVAVPAGATVITASGHHVYPGLFDALTRLGLSEIGAVDVTNDYLELGTFNPHLLGLTAVHPASELIPVARANGITHATAAPAARGGGIGGQASLVNLHGWTIEEMLVAPSVGMIVDWPNLSTREFDFSTFSFRERPYKEVKKEYDQRRDSLAAWLSAARQYVHAVEAGTEVERDLKLEALGKVTGGELPLLVTASSERQIRDALDFAEQHEVRIVILRGNEAYKVAELLVEKDVPVILGPVQALPTSENEPYDEQYAHAAKLHRAGVKFAISTFGASAARTLPYEAGTAVPYGLPRDEAIKAVTLYPAQILGVADRLGTIEVGKLANLIVTDADPLEIQTHVTHVVIGGREASLQNRHLELYEKYRARPK